MVSFPAVEYDLLKGGVSMKKGDSGKHKDWWLVKTLYLTKHKAINILLP